MDRYQIVMKNALTGEEVCQAVYCNGFAVITAVGDEGEHGCCTQGGFAARHISAAEIAGVMYECETLKAAMEVVNKVRKWEQEQAQPINRLKRWFRDKLQKLDAWMRGEETREESA